MPIAISTTTYTFYTSNLEKAQFCFCATDWFLKNPRKKIRVKTDTVCIQKLGIGSSFEKSTKITSFRYVKSSLLHGS